MRDDRRIVFPPLKPAEDDPDSIEFGDPIGRLKLLERVLELLGLWTALHLPLKPAEDFEFAVRLWEGRPFVPITTRMNEQRNLQLFQSVDLAAAPVIFSGDDIRRLSSGETAMLRFAAQAVAAIETGSLFLFDEPETHLHPTFISEFVEVLHLLLTQTRSVAVIATHSVYVVRETPSQRVRILSMIDGQIAVDPPRMQTFGASIEGISQAVFGDGRIRHQFQKTLEDWLARGGDALEIGEILARYGHEMNSETLSYVARKLGRTGSDAQN